MSDNSRRPLRPLLTLANIAVVVVVLAMGPATVLIGRGVHDKSDVSWAPAIVAAVVAVVGYVVCYVMRKSASERYVAKASLTGTFAGSLVFVYTLVAWVLIAAAGGIAGGTSFVSRTAGASIEEGSYRDVLAKTPLVVLFLFVGLVVLAGAGYSAWEYRRWHEFPKLAERGISRLVKPRREPMRKRTRMWLQGVRTDGLLFVSGLLPVLFSGAAPPEADLVRGVLGVVGGPGIVSFVLLVVMLFLWPTRRSAFDALRQPSSLVAVALVAVGGPVFGDTTIGGFVVLAGVLLASITCMNIMDRGGQPWLGFVFYAGNYMLGYFFAPDGDAVLPTGIIGWVIALAAAAYTVRDVRNHWRRWTNLEPLSKPAGDKAQETS